MARPFSNLFSRTREFQIGAVSHQHLLARGQKIGLSATQYALAQGSGSKEGHDYHMDRAGLHGFQSAQMNAHADVIPTGTMKVKTRKKNPPRTPVNKVDQN